MGKPFEKEIEKTEETLQWALQQTVDDLRQALIENERLPLFVVGSGGSLSACHLAAMLYQQYGIMAKAVTPLELIYSKPALRNSNILFISASGRNTDILFGYKTALSMEPNHIFSICMKKGSPLALMASKNANSSTFEYPIPAGKDGFLATNSLIGFFGILIKALSISGLESPTFEKDNYSANLDVFMEQVSPDFTFSVIHAGWGQAIGIDLESKLAEAALGDILVSDWRNFGHGRHHWFDKRGKNSAIVALITPAEAELAEKTLKFLPEEIPVLRISSSLNGPAASLDLLIKSFEFVNRLGKKQGIDPGRPGVPDFGSKLYHLNYQKYFKTSGKVAEITQLSIIRKSGIPNFETLTDPDLSYWLNAHNTFVNSLKGTTFGCIIFDYDGTICSAKNRKIGVDKSTAVYLNQILGEGIILGIATGRGQSVRQNLQAALDEKFWDQVIIGYYNCSDIALLKDNTQPDKSVKQNKKLQEIFTALSKQSFVVEICPELKPHQIVIEIDDKSNWQKVRLSIIHFVISLNIPNIQILESSHSMDIIDQTESNKLNIINHCEKAALARGLSEDCLCIGDKGKWPGNDYQLLSHRYSLSVDETSSTPNSCWNLSPAGTKNLEATIYYLSCLRFNHKGVNLEIK